MRCISKVELLEHSRAAAVKLSYSVSMKVYSQRGARLCQASTQVLALHSLLRFLCLLGIQLSTLTSHTHQQTSSHMLPKCCR